MKTKIFLGILLINFTTIINAQQYDCGDIWRSIDDYQTGRYSNITFTGHVCLTDSLKNKLISVLRNEYTDEEMDARITRDMGSKWLQYIERDTRNILAKDSLLNYQQIKDSLMNAELAYWKTKAQNRRIDKSVITLISFLDIKEAIPTLHEAIKDPKRYDTYTIEIALARLRDSVYYKKYFNEWSKPFDNEKDMIQETGHKKRLIFLATQESMYALSKYLSIDKGEYTVSGSAELYYHVGYDVLYTLYQGVKNEDFQQYFKENFLWSFLPMYAIEKKDVNKPAISFAIDWMEANKGKYIIDRDFSVRLED